MRYAYLPHVQEIVSIPLALQYSRGHIEDMTKTNYESMNKMGYGWKVPVPRKLKAERKAWGKWLTMWGYIGQAAKGFPQQQEGK